MSARLSVLVIGGGASGVLLAAQLLAEGRDDIRVTIVERRDVIGRGVAYSARQLDHVLNVPATGMSAFPNDASHFWRWLRDRNLIREDERYTFVPRRHYGTYLADVLEGLDPHGSGRLQKVQAEVLELKVTPAGVEAVLDNGTSIMAHVGVLAVGHEENPARAKGIAVRVGSEQDTPLDPQAPVMVLGSGLSMIDAWLSLANAGHRGQITVVSRNGLLPRMHKQVEPIPLAAADVPFGTELHYFTRWFRDLIAQVHKDGLDWRSVVDALRPFNQRIWQNWSIKSRKRFLAHVRPFWNIHRHRLPPDLHHRMMEAVMVGQVKLVAGTFLDVARSAEGEGVVATVRHKGEDTTEKVEIARVYDCGGVSVDIEKSSNPVVQGLLASGHARPDTLHIGMDVTTECQVLDVNGEPSPRLFAVGPLTRGTFFEIEAIPDIRVQCAALAARLREMVVA